MNMHFNGDKNIYIGHGLYYELGKLLAQLHGYNGLFLFQNMLNQYVLNFCASTSIPQIQ